ncbi:N-6 DNA methylase [Gemmobacter fulvus]|uniref:N-6 DNA methylase n=1 Tax=Gemmobacter fulvus TaxID=2840474 RepID=UPI002796C4C3|nr:N-6 DNA methylase [Gemmobacter fulvus]MDQ1850736.1 N-6 DNA methylase [Gemmobacter fulvus]
MANEELGQRGYIQKGELKGDGFGAYEQFNIGATSVTELVKAGLPVLIPSKVPFKFIEYKATKNTKNAKVDRLYVDRRSGTLKPIFVAEWKQATEFNDEKKKKRACEQALFDAYVFGVDWACATDGSTFIYIDVKQSIADGMLTVDTESRALTPAIIEDLLSPKTSLKDPTDLAKKIWQKIWQATKEEPKACLLTFVELFMLKFLSDNLPVEQMPRNLSFYELVTGSNDEFRSKHGQSQIEHYVKAIRPHVKSLFPENTIVVGNEPAKFFGLKSLTSKTSVINGFAFLRSTSSESAASFNRIFVDILKDLDQFGSLTRIDPEFKLRLYETFLKNTPSQQSLGQFFTPRNVVKEMVRMSRLDKLPDGSLVLDPAAGVGGFVLEPLLMDGALKGNFEIKSGKPVSRVRLVGIDLDVSTHILAKANTLIHLSDLLSQPTTTLDALNALMAQTFVLMNENETLGALEFPAKSVADVILANPPYVTDGSGVYRKELGHIAGTRNGTDLKEYYAGWGLGLESLFIRYISGALKAGARAFVIVPLGFLNRSESKSKEKLLRECNIIASISLPRRTFFNTNQATSILVLEKRHTIHDERPDVMCAYIRSIGESLDTYRLPEPHKNDLKTAADFFIGMHDEDEVTPAMPDFIRVVGADEFDANSRWDVDRFWTEEEKVALGLQDPVVSEGGFLAQASSHLEDLMVEIKALKDATKSSSNKFETFSLSDTKLFSVRSGQRIRNVDIKANPGQIPVYSCFKERDTIKGMVSEDYLLMNNFTIESPKNPVVTIAANGSVGAVFTRAERCLLTDDLIIVEPKHKDIDIGYLAIAIRKAVAGGGYGYEAKLFRGRVEQLTIDLPMLGNGEFDVEIQKDEAARYRRLEDIRKLISGFGTWGREVKVS